MIDIHAHLLPGLDDGAKTLEESIQMCRISYGDGVRTIVATPHTLADPYQNDRSTVLSKVRELNTAIRKFGVGSSEFGVQDLKSEKKSFSLNHSAIRIPQSAIDFRVLAGSDVHLCERTLAHFDKGELVTLNDGNKFLLIEFPFHGVPYGAEEALFQLIKRGITPIITHPERNFEIGQRPQRFYEMIRTGCLGQVTAMSLTGEFGRKVRQVAEKLLSHCLIHFIASDAHSTNGRSPILSKAVRAAGKIVGEREAKKLVAEYPQTILEGQKPNTPQPISF